MKEACFLFFSVWISQKKNLNGAHDFKNKYVLTRSLLLSWSARCKYCLRLQRERHGARQSTPCSASSGILLTDGVKSVKHTLTSSAVCHLNVCSHNMYIQARSMCAHTHSFTHTLAYTFVEQVSKPRCGETVLITRYFPYAYDFNFSLQSW